MFPGSRSFGAVVVVVVLAFAPAVVPAWGQSHHHGSAGHGPPPLLAVAGGGSYGYGFPYYSGIGFDGFPFTYAPPLLWIAPGGMPPFFAPAAAPSPLSSGVGVAGPLPPPELVPPQVPAAAELVRPRRPDPTRAGQLVTFGDRHLRAGNLHKAAERYAQALNADPNSAAPRVRMAQIALIRGQYAEAADRYREAMIAQPGWLTNAPDIQAIYGEPSDFARQIAKLETHLQANPNDRDAWIVLGAQWYLSGQTRKAADVFLRLSDRKPDATLAAFLDAAIPGPPAAQ